MPMQIEMYADTNARGGVLEPEGIVEIKFRAADLISTMHRLDPIILDLKTSSAAGAETAIKKREAELMPIYRQVKPACLLSFQRDIGIDRLWSLPDPHWQSFYFEKQYMCTASGAGSSLDHLSPCHGSTDIMTGL